MYKHRDEVVLNHEHVVNIPQEELPEPRREELKRYLTAVTKAPPLPPDWDWHWVVKRGKYAGTMPKRISAFYHKEHRLDLDPKLLEWIGNFAKKNSSPTQNYYFDLVDSVVWHAGHYGDTSSCYWGSNKLAIDVLLEHKSFAMRFYWPPSKGGWRGRARCWVATDKAQGFVLFNSYDAQAGGRSDKAPPDSHPIELFTMARVLGTHMGLSYKRIGLTNGGDSGGLVYINSGGYLVGETADIEPIEEMDLKWSQVQLSCSLCGKRVPMDEIFRFYPDSAPICVLCRNTHYKACAMCRVYLPVGAFNKGMTVCNSCEEYYYEACALCGKKSMATEMQHVYDLDGLLCRSCLGHHTEMCGRCGTRRHHVLTKCRCQELYPVQSRKTDAKERLTICYDCQIPILGEVYSQHGHNLCHVCARVVKESEAKNESENEEA